MDKSIRKFNLSLRLLQPPSKKNQNGKSAPSTPALTEAIKKRTERFGDVAQVAKANTANVCCSKTDSESVLLLSAGISGTKGQTHRTIQTDNKCLVNRRCEMDFPLLSRITLSCFFYILLCAAAGVVVLVLVQKQKEVLVSMSECRNNSADFSCDSLTSKCDEV